MYIKSLNLDWNLNDDLSNYFERCSPWWKINKDNEMKPVELKNPA